MNYPTCTADYPSCDEQYFHVDISCRNATVVIKMEDEGAVTDTRSSRAKQSSEPPTPA
jgi:hypothetical protein